MQPELRSLVDEALAKLQANDEISSYVDTSLPVPKPFEGTGEIKLVVLGQDPTIRDAMQRQRITTSLNLDRRGSLLVYLSGVCKGLGIELSENVYATNLFKNFFITPPTEITGVPIFNLALSIWLPVLRHELQHIPTVPVITLGEPILKVLAEKSASSRVSKYWGHVRGWQQIDHTPEFGHLREEENILGRKVFPFPHQPSLRKQYYGLYLPDYVRYVREVAFTPD